MGKDIAIRVENVSKTFRIPHEKISSLRGAFVNLFRSNPYEEFKALDDVSFEVKKGEFFGIIGRNGSGKSTLLKILAGIYHPEKGKIKVNGLVSPFLELGIGFNPELSGRDNIYLNAAVLGLAHKQIDEKFDDIVNFSELRRFIDQKVKNYSSGMQVRLAFSVAIHANRDILLMDEVLAVGDSNFQSKCLAEFNKYRDVGKTVILVTHDIGMVQRYCDKAILLREGKIQMIGNPDKVGSEYIYQNMTDEEKRILEEEGYREKKEEKAQDDNEADKNSSKKKFNSVFNSSKRAIFEQIQLLDQRGDKISVVEYDQPVTLRMAILAKEDITNLAFGYHIRDLNGIDFVYSDSIIENCSLRNIRKNKRYVIDWKFKMSLSHDIYKIACVLSIPINLEKSQVDFCDFIGNAIKFRMNLRKGSFLYGRTHWTNNVEIKLR